MNMNRRSWTEEEDRVLLDHVGAHGARKWDAVARTIGIGRNGNSCRHRWVNYLSPNVRRGNITDQEMLVILCRRDELGNKWSQIARELPGRTDNEIKNFWNTRVKKEAKQLGLHVESPEFLQQMIERIQTAVMAAAPSMNPGAELALPFPAATGGDDVAASSLSAAVDHFYFPNNSDDFPFVDLESYMNSGGEHALVTLPPSAATGAGGVMQSSLSAAATGGSGVVNPGGEHALIPRPPPATTGGSGVTASSLTGGGSFLIDDEERGHLDPSVWIDDEERSILGLLM